MRAHIIRVHNLDVPPSEPKFDCEDCSCSFRKLGSLNAHVSKFHLPIKAGAESDQNNFQVKSLKTQTCFNLVTKILKFAKMQNYLVLTYFSFLYWSTCLVFCFTESSIKYWRKYANGNKKKSINHFYNQKCNLFFERLQAKDLLSQALHSTGLAKDPTSNDLTTTEELKGHMVLADKDKDGKVR